MNKKIITKIILIFIGITGWLLFFSESIHNPNICSTDYNINDSAKVITTDTALILPVIDFDELSYMRFSGQSISIPKDAKLSIISGEITIGTYLACYDAGFFGSYLVLYSDIDPWDTCYNTITYIDTLFIVDSLVTTGTIYIPPTAAIALIGNTFYNLSYDAIVADSCIDSLRYVPYKYAEEI